MTKSNKDRIYSIISGVIYVIISISSFISFVENDYYDESILASLFINSIVSLILAISFFIGKKNILFTVVFSLDLIGDIFVLVLGNGNIEVANILNYIYDLSVIFIAYICTSEKYTKLLNKTWFIPIITSVIYGVSVSNINIMSSFLIICPAILISLFFKPDKVRPNVPAQDSNSELKTEINDSRIVESEPQKNTESAEEIKSSNNSQPPKTSGANFDADKLLEYKKLLDDGVITQEDFDKIKNSIMNS